VYEGWNEDVDWCVVKDAKEPASVSLLAHQLHSPILAWYTYSKLCLLFRALCSSYDGRGMVAMYMYKEEAKSCKP